MSKEQIIKHLDGVIELLKTPDNWCKYSLAKDVNGNSVAPTNPNACKWCLEGAIMKITSDDGVSSLQVRSVVSKQINDLYNNKGIYNFNDEATSNSQIITLLSNVKYFVQSTNSMPLAASHTTAVSSKNYFTENPYRTLFWLLIVGIICASVILNR